MRLFFHLICVSFFSYTSALHNLENSQTFPLTDADHFLIYYAFADSALEEPLKEEMINQLKKFGAVFSGDDTKLTKQQKDKKYQVGLPILDIIVSPIIEESNEFSDFYKKLPIVEIRIKVKTGVQLIENGSQIPAVVWEGHRYISTMRDKDKFIEKAAKSLNILLDKFKIDYQKANPSKDEKKPQFYLYY